MLDSNFYTSTTFAITLFVSVAIILFVLLILNQFRIRRSLIKIQKQLDKSLNSNKTIHAELNATSSGAIGLGQRLLFIEKQIKELRARHQDMVSFGNDDKYQKKTYKQASQLALMGASIDDLKQSCELSQGEAELLSHMSSLQTH